MDFVANGTAICPSSKSKTFSSCATGSTCFRFSKKMRRRSYRQRITATCIGHRPTHASVFACGAIVSSLEVLQSMEVPQLAEPLILCPLPDTRFSFRFASSVFRSSPFEKPSPKGFSNDTTQTLPPGRALPSPVMDTVDVRFYPSVLSSSLLRLVPPKHRNEPATALQHARSGIPDSYSSHTPRLLRLKYPDTTPGAADQGGCNSPSRISNGLRSTAHVARTA